MNAPRPEGSARHGELRVPGGFAASDDRIVDACAAAARLVAVVGAGLLVASCSTMRAPAGRQASDFAAIKPGMTRDELTARLGPPTWTFGVRQENLTIYNYRLNRSDCMIYQVSLRPDGTVKDTAPASDPDCDKPD